MDLYDLGPVSWWESQCYYHALAHLGREGLIVCYPSSPYVCLGLHDDLEQEIDREFCVKWNIPLFRRETGGGVVYLDDRQVFFQLVVKRDNPQLPLRRHRYYDKFLQPAILTYQHFGVPAQLKEPADIAAGGKKCSGNACGDIGDCVAYVGNILLDFDCSIMSNILSVPHPQYREYLHQAMQSNMTTLKDWGIYSPGYAEVASQLIAGFAAQWGELNPRMPDQVLTQKAAEIYQRSTSEAWLEMPGRRHQDRKIKIAEGLFLMERKLGLERRAMVLVRDGKVENIKVSGREEFSDRLNIDMVGREWNEDLWAAI